ncbi:MULTISPECIES: DUF6538 domain-containing protein [unclassified Achromobacter]|uniref:DUF6538 domain-containing protein n=1 Tax=unclassified Achromobacter TaxID=2626865 RepID=UPI00117793F9|nr:MULTISPECIES: DUF6538 domain-containing protein [unclassified Achromobacter]
MPVLPTGLQRHSKSGTYYLRRRIPTDLLTCYPGKKEVIHSLKTKDYRTALERHRQGEAELTREWQLRRQKMAREFRQQAKATAAQQGWPPIRIDDLTAPAISSICSHYQSASLAGDERRRTNSGYDLEDVHEYRQGYAEVLQTLKDATATNDIKMLQQPLDEFLRFYRYEINHSSTARWTPYSSSSGTRSSAPTRAFFSASTGKGSRRRSPRSSPRPLACQR